MWNELRGQRWCGRTMVKALACPGAYSNPAGCSEWPGLEAVALWSLELCKPRAKSWLYHLLAQRPGKSFCLRELQFPHQWSHCFLVVCSWPNWFSSSTSTVSSIIVGLVWRSRKIVQIQWFSPIVGQVFWDTAFEMEISVQEVSAECSQYQHLWGRKGSRTALWQSEVGHSAVSSSASADHKGVLQWRWASGLSKLRWVSRTFTSSAVDAGYSPKRGMTWGWMVLFSQGQSLDKADSRQHSEHGGGGWCRDKSFNPEGETGWHITVSVVVLDT